MQLIPLMASIRPQTQKVPWLDYQLPSPTSLGSPIFHRHEGEFTEVGVDNIEIIQTSFNSTCGRRKCLKRY